MKIKTFRIFPFRVVFRRREKETVSRTSVNFGYIPRFSTGSRFISTQYEKEADALCEVIRDDEYVDICPNCGGLFSQNARGRRKKFCSEKCRTAWNHRHPNPANWKNTSRTCICPQCGKEFIATREYGQLRKYCSIPCSNRGRAAERKRNDTGTGVDHGDPGNAGQPSGKQI